MLSSSSSSRCISFLYKNASSSFTKRFQSSASSTINLHSVIIGNGTSDSSTNTVFLHGLLGNGRNLNTFAKQVCQLNNSTGYLIDLRGHGKSRIASSSCKNSFENCVKDIAVATKKFSVPVESIVGHSFGGRIALQYAATQQNSSLERVWLLDTVPGQANDRVEQVVDAVDKVLKQLKQENLTMDRNLVVKTLQEDFGLDAGIATWLGSSFSDGDFGFDLEVIQDILPEFHTQDFWGLLNEIIASGKRVDLVRGGKNMAWDINTLRRLEGLQNEYPNHFGVHVLPQAGHWVHVDDLKGLVKLFAKY